MITSYFYPVLDKERIIRGTSADFLWSACMSTCMSIMFYISDGQRHKNGCNDAIIAPPQTHTHFLQSGKVGY